MSGKYLSFAELNKMADLTKLKGMPELPITVHSAKYGREMHGPCPFCKTGEDRFMVNIDKSPMRYYCRQCQAKGQAMDFIAYREGLSIKRDSIQIANILYQEIDPEANHTDLLFTATLSPSSKGKENPVKPTPPNSPEWRKNLLRVVQRAADLIFESKGKAGLDYLYSRGFCDETIRKYHIGYIPEDRKWHDFHLQKGITIPTFMADDLYRVKIRYLSNNRGPKYTQIAKSDGSCLFNSSDTLQYPDILFVEGEFDAMIVNQALERAGNRRIRAVTFGSAQSRPSTTTYYRFFRLPTRIIICYDNDPAGSSGANALLASINSITNRSYPAFMKTLPVQSNCSSKDWNEYYLNGGNIPELLENWFPMK